MSALSPSSPLANITDFSIEPSNISQKIVGKRYDFIGTRLLSLLQIITSVLALPILLAVGLLEAAFYAITCQGAKAKEAIQLLSGQITVHTLFIIPGSILEILLPKPWSKAIIDPWADVAVQIARLAACACCESESNSTDTPPNENDIHPNRNEIRPNWNGELQY